MESENISPAELRRTVRSLTASLALLLLIWRLPEIITALLQ
ncbi:MAG: photosystem I reaction center subunit PsaK [Neisseria sp.]|nr:photosystem I reaction center subunit PsaK [Neisseria sp.]